jgi:hypothetical protein
MQNEYFTVAACKLSNKRNLDVVSSTSRGSFMSLTCSHEVLLLTGNLSLFGIADLGLT